MQTQSAVDQIRQRLSGIADIYNRLVLLVGPSGSGKTASLRALADAEKVPVLNVGSEISRRLLDLTERQRILQLPTLLEEAVAGLPGNLTILDNTEVLLNHVLKQDTLRLLQGMITRSGRCAAIRPPMRSSTRAISACSSRPP